MRLFLSILAVAIVLVNPAFGRKKVRERNWQAGKLLDSQRSEQYAGTVQRPGVVLTNGRRITNDSARAVYVMQEMLVIESETYTYTVSEFLGRRGKPANLTINGPVKFAVKGQTLYLIDEDGNEYGTEIVNKVLRTPEGVK